MFEAGQKVDVSGTTIGKGFAGVIKRHHFSSNRASHGNSRLAQQSPGSIGMAQDPGRVFPGKRMSGHLGNVTRTVQLLEIARVDAERSLIMVQGLGARREEQRRDRAPEREGQGAQGREGSQIMELKVINEKGEAQKSVDASETLFGREYNEALVHQVVVAYQANGRQGTRQQKTRAEVAPLDQEAVAPEGHRPRARGHDVAPAVARRRADLPEQARRELHARSSTARCIAPAWPRSCRSWCARSAWRWSRRSRVDAPKTKVLAGKLAAMGLERRADPHRQARREPVPVLAQPAQRPGARSRATPTR